MLKLLIGKQFTEIFRSYFYNVKTGEVKPKKKTITSIVLFACLMFFLVGGMFFAFAMGLGMNTCSTPYSWFYFLIFGLLAVAIGVFGSVFTTYSVLYISKDNDLLLSMPIPVSYIVVSRILAVYLIGILYSAFVYIPAVIVDFIYSGWSFGALISGISGFLTISLLVLALSCFLGYVVARVSLVLTNKSIGKVLITLLLLVGYYVVYFKLIAGVDGVMENPGAYGEKLKANTYILYKFGSALSGDILTSAVVLGIAVLLAAVTWYLISHSFIKTATATGKGEKAGSKELRYGKNDAKRAIFKKELSRFTSSAGYMLNAGLGLVMFPIAGIVILLKSESITPLLYLFGDYTTVIATTFGIMLCSMNDISAPSVSLEGRNIWIYRSMPVEPGEVLKGKLKMALSLSLPSVIFGTAAIGAVVSWNILETVCMVGMTAAFTVLSSITGLVMGLKFPNLTWTNETVVIKQGIPVLTAVFGGWAFSVVFGGLYVLLGVVFGILINQALYIAIFIALTVFASILLYRWMMNKGAEIFGKL